MYDDFSELDDLKQQLNAVMRSVRQLRQEYKEASKQYSKAFEGLKQQSEIVKKLREETLSPNELRARLGNIKFQRDNYQKECEAASRRRSEIGNALKQQLLRLEELKRQLEESRQLQQQRYQLERTLFIEQLEEDKRRRYQLQIRRQQLEEQSSLIDRIDQLIELADDIIKSRRFKNEFCRIYNLRKTQTGIDIGEIIIEAVLSTYSSRLSVTALVVFKLSRMRIDEYCDE